MRGDGMDAMAMAIRVASWLLAVVPVVAGGWLGQRWLRQRWGANVGMIVGSTIGAALVLWAFGESYTSPTPQLTFDVPTDFAHESVILIADPSSQRELAWTSGSLPFSVKRAVLAVPRSGIVRLKTLGLVAERYIDAQLTDGRSYRSYVATQLDGAPVVEFNFVDSDQRKEPALEMTMSETTAVRIVEQVTGAVDAEKNCIHRRGIGQAFRELCGTCSVPR